MRAQHHSGPWSALQGWLQSRPPLRVVVCDVYGTLLHCQDAPNRAAQGLIQEGLDTLVAHAHQCATRPFPEVDEIALWRALRPEITSCAQLARQARHHARRMRHAVLAPGAAEFLLSCPLPLALCSNAQAATLMELRLALRAAGLRLRRFALERSFLSYQHGTAKPNPWVFAHLNELWPGPAAELLMVGDRLDNDIQPACQAGWSTWHLTERGL